MRSIISLKITTFDVEDLKVQQVHVSLCKHGLVSASKTQATHPCAKLEPKTKIVIADLELKVLAMLMNNYQTTNNSTMLSC